MAAAPKLSKPAMKALLARASKAACEAYEAATPTPMLVGTPKNMMASLLGGDDGGFDPAEPVYRVPSGVVGFAWVNIKPGTSRFARFLKTEGVGDADSYYGGVTVRGSRMGVPVDQSYERNMAAADAFAKVLREAGIKAYASGRLD